VLADAVTQYIVLEIHYNNPEKTAGIIDSSGVRMTMTADLRPIDAGIFVLGVNTGDINIPADTEVYEVRHYHNEIECSNFSSIVDFDVQ
jgi:dopamine beta-monooxygenase